MYQQPPPSDLQSMLQILIDQQAQTQRQFQEQQAQTQRQLQEQQLFNQQLLHNLEEQSAINQQLRDTISHLQQHVQQTPITPQQIYPSTPQPQLQQNLYQTPLSPQPQLQIIPSTPIHPQPPPLPITPTTRSGFSVFAEHLFRRQQPQEYNRLSQLPDFDPEFFTVDYKTSSKAHYVKHKTPRSLGQLGVYFNNAIWNTIPQGSRDGFRKDKDEQRRIRMHPVDDLNYRPREASNIKNSHRAAHLTNQYQTPANKKSMVKAIKQLGASNVPQIQQQRTPNSVSAIALQREYPHMIDDISNISEFAVFDGIITKSIYTIDSHVLDQGLTTSQFAEIIKKSLFHRLNLDYPEPQEMPPYYTIYAFYTGPPDSSGANAPDARIPISSGISPSDIESLTLLPNLAEELEEVLGSDPTDQSNNFFLDISRFEIDKIDVMMLGGVTGFRILPSKSKKYHILDVPWGIVRDYPSKNEGCFLKILKEVLSSSTPKIHNPFTLKNWRYQDLWVHLDQILQTDTKNTGVTAQWAQQAAKHFNLHLIVHNIEGDIILGGEEDKRSSASTDSDTDPMGSEYARHTEFIPSTSIIRVCLCEEHFTHVINYKPLPLTASKPRDTPGNEKRDPPIHISTNVYYDLETIYTTEAGAGNHVTPYSNTWLIDDNKPHTIIIRNLDTSYLVFDDMLTHIEAHFTRREDVKEILATSIPFNPNANFGSPQTPQDLGMRSILSPPNVHVTYRCIAYNGSRFDHLLLFLHLLHGGWHIINNPSPTGKMRSMKVYLGNYFWKSSITSNTGWTSPSSKYKERNTGRQAKCYLEIWDPCLFTCAPLAKVATDFKLPLSKTFFDHAEVQQAYESGQLSHWLETHRIAIEKYNQRDVEVLKELTEKLIENFPNMYKYTTIAGMCYSVWRGMSIKEVQPPNQLLRRQPRLKQISDYITKVKHVEDDLRIRSSIVGGRVQALVGDWKSDTLIFDDTTPIGPMVMYDIVSLYPFVMAERSYPVGEEIRVINKEVAENYYKNPAYIGLYYCYYDQISMQGKYPHCILPVRKADGRLDWNTFSSGEGWLPDVTIKDLIEAGCPLQIMQERTDEEKENKILSTDINAICALVWVRNNDVFKEYVEIYSRIKQEEDRKKMENKDYNSVLREMSKLMLNSLSGKMVQKNYKDKWNMWRESEKLREWLKEKMEIGVKPELNYISENTVWSRETKNDEEAYRGGHPSQLGVFIYAYARSYMWKLFFSRMDVIYSDTDSAVVRTENAGVLENEKLEGGSLLFPTPLIVTGMKKFGMLEKEMDLDEIKVCAPKIYMIKKDGKVIKWRIKGVRMDDMWEGGMVKDKVEEFMERLLKDKEVTVESWAFRNNVKNDMFERRVLKKVLRLTD